MKLAFSLPEDISLCAMGKELNALYPGPGQPGNEEVKGETKQTCPEFLGRTEIRNAGTLNGVKWIEARSTMLEVWEKLVARSWKLTIKNYENERIYDGQQ